MIKRVNNRIENILEQDKLFSPQAICDVLKEEIKPIVENYINLQDDIKVRFKKESNKNIFFIEIDANRTKPFGYIPY